MKKDHFYISVSNGLLKDSHQKRMGSAVWQYLWCLDKVTKIDERGMGLVLGGKPVNLRDIEGTHRITVSNNLSKLKKEGYIEITRTPYGLVIKVAKMKKRFNEKANSGIRENAKSKLKKSLNHVSETTKSRKENAKSNKTISVDNISRQYSKTHTPKDLSEKFFKGVEDLNKKIESDEAKSTQVFLAEVNRKYALEKVADKKTLWDEIRKFTNYWTELTHGGRKQRYECQKTFEVAKRLTTWLNRTKQFKEPTITKKSNGKELIWD